VAKRRSEEARVLLSPKPIQLKPCMRGEHCFGVFQPSPVLSFIMCSRCGYELKREDRHGKT